MLPLVVVLLSLRIIRNPFRLHRRCMTSMVGRLTVLILFLFFLPFFFREMHTFKIKFSKIYSPKTMCIIYYFKKCVITSRIRHIWRANFNFFSFKSVTFVIFVIWILRFHYLVMVVPLLGRKYIIQHL